MSQTAVAWLYLSGAIICEVTGTTFLGKSSQFTKLVPTVFAIVAYCGSFYLLAQALRWLPIGLAYAIWAGVGVMLTLFVGLVVFKQKTDMAAVIGVALIVAGVVVVNLCSIMNNS